MIGNSNLNCIERESGNLKNRSGGLAQTIEVVLTSRGCYSHWDEIRETEMGIRDTNSLEVGKNKEILGKLTKEINHRMSRELDSIMNTVIKDTESSSVIN